jgi:hypothetical protein
MIEGSGRIRRHASTASGRSCTQDPHWNLDYSGRKITESLGNVTVKGKNGKSKGGARLSTVCLSMYSITENIYYSQLSSVTILLKPEPNCFTSYNTKIECVLSPSVLSSFGLPLPPTCLVLTASEARSYIASTIIRPCCKDSYEENLLFIILKESRQKVVWCVEKKENIDWNRKFL